MAIEFFLCPIVQVTTPHGSTAWAPAVYQHRAQGERVASIMPNPNGGGKNWTIAVVVDPSAAMTAAINADATITRLPWTDATLDDPVSTLSQGAQTALTNALSSRRIPTGWIVATTPIRMVLRFTYRILDMVTLLKADFPEADLTAQWNTFSAAQRTRIRNALLATGVDPTALGVTGTTTIGQALLLVVNARMSTPVVVGPVTL